MQVNKKNARKIKQVAAVVVTYNRKELLLQCIEKIRGQQNAKCDILLVDNGSSDGTREMIQAIADDHLYYRNTGCNLGGAGGFQFGMRWAVEAGYELVWIMDDDTLPEPDALSELLKADALLNGNYGFLSSVVLWTDGHECKMNRQVISKQYYHYLDLLSNGMIEVQQATFVSLLVHANVIRKIGLPIKEFFIWGDDIEYTRRIADKWDKPSFLVGKSRVIHAMKSNNGSDIAIDEIGRINRYRYAYRNENYTYRQRGFSGFCRYLGRCAKHMIRVWRFAPNHRIKRSWIILSGMIRGCFFHPKIEYIQQSEREKC